MKTYCYLTTGGERGETLETVTITDKEILEDYWDHWYAGMITKYGEGDELITEENCIDDWCVIHRAIEVKDA